MSTFLLILQLIIAIALTLAILLQTSKGGLSQGMGGDYYRTKRGLERFIFILTIILAGLFLAISILNLRLI